MIKKKEFISPDSPSLNCGNSSLDPSRTSVSLPGHSRMDEGIYFLIRKNSIPALVKRKININITNNPFYNGYLKQNKLKRDERVKKNWIWKFVGAYVYNGRVF